jgi:coenzyme F420-reducing hydrogenase alpha subunit
MTAHSLLAVERAFRVAAERTITPERVELELEQVVEREVDASSPCIACATP